MSSSKLKEYSMLWTSQRAPGDRFQNHVPPTPSPISNTVALKPCWRSLCSMYKPEKPAPTTTASKSTTPTVGTPTVSATSVICPLRDDGDTVTREVYQVSADSAR